MSYEQKAQRYQYLLSEFDKMSNEIASIKGENLEMNESQNNRIARIQSLQAMIVNEMTGLMG